MLDFSVATIVIMTAEKLYAIYKPMKARLLKYNRKRSIYIVLIALLICSLMNFHFLITHSVTNIQLNNLKNQSSNISNSTIMCANDKWFLFYNYYWPYIDATLYSFLPFLLITVLNILIVVCLVKEKKESCMLQKSLQKKSPLNKTVKAEKENFKLIRKNTSLSVKFANERKLENMIDSCISINKSKNENENLEEASLKILKASRMYSSCLTIKDKISFSITENNNLNKQLRRRSEIVESDCKKNFKNLIMARKIKKNKSIFNNNKRTATVIFTINIAFCVFTMPLVVLQIIDNQLRSSYSNNESNNNDVLDLLKAIFELLQYLNHSLNIVLYSFSSKTIRDATKALLTDIMCFKFRNNCCKRNLRCFNFH